MDDYFFLVMNVSVAFNTGTVIMAFICDLKIMKTKRIEESNRKSIVVRSDV